MNPLDRRRRTRILVLGDPQLCRSWADDIRSRHVVETLEPARAGLVMVQVRESARRSVFHLGEVLVTEAKVRVASRPGLGLLRGWDPERAVDLAVIDAACRAGLPEAQQWLPRLVAAEAQLEVRLADERSLLDTTKVDFQTMDQEASL